MPLVTLRDVTAIVRDTCGSPLLSGPEQDIVFTFQNFSKGGRNEGKDAQYSMFCNYKSIFYPVFLIGVQYGRGIGKT